MGRYKFGKKPGPRKIDGKTYHWIGWGHSSENAQARKNELKGKGYSSIRVIKDKPSKTLTQAYQIYGRRKRR